MNRFFAILSSVLCVLLLIATLALGYIHFTIGSPDSFAKGVADSIDAKMLKGYIDSRIDLHSDTYGFDSQSVKDSISADHLRDAAAEYFTGYFTAFASGDASFPAFTYSTDAIYDAVNENADKAQRPQLFESEESRQKLAGVYVKEIQDSITSLSLQTLYDTALKLRAPYLKVASLGKFFAPSAIVFIIVLALTAALIVYKKMSVISYVASLLFFAVSALFTTVMTYLSQIDLSAKLNVSIGMSSVYIDAICNFLITKASYVYLAISIFALALFAVSVVFNVVKKK